MKLFWHNMVTARYERYKKLYGEGVSYRHIEKKLKHKMILAALVMGLALAATFLEGGPGLEPGGFITDGQGNLTRIVRPENGQDPVAFTAEVQLKKGEESYLREIPVLIYPIQNGTWQGETARKQETERSEQLRLIQKEVYRMNLDAESQVLSFPVMLEDGTEITWKKTAEGRKPHWFLLMVALLLLLYKTFDMKLKREEIKARDSIIRDLPEFAEKLMLLLSAGLVLHHALEKIAGDLNHFKGEALDYFYGRYQILVTQSREANLPIQQGLKEFAGSSGIPEFVRLSNLISDGAKQGTDLVNRLKMERDTLWFARKKRAEERGRIAETKLTMPLVILLLVLVMITIAPTMMEM